MTSVVNIPVTVYVYNVIVNKYFCTLDGRTCLARTLSSFSLLSSFSRATSCFALSRTGGRKREGEEK